MNHQIINADCLEAMAAMPASSVDAIVTDPPYGLAFMGKAWDHAVPGPEFFVEMLRVAKPGAYLLAFGGTRLYHRMTCAIEDAGWEVRDCLMWLYGSGFPKSHNGAWGGTALKPAWEPIILARKPLIGTVEANHAAHGTGGLNVDACRVEGLPPWERQGPMYDMRGGRMHAAAPPIRRNDLPPYKLGHEGRWPANVVLDEDAGAVLDAQSGERTSGQPRPATGSRARQSGFAVTDGCGGYGDTGGASRFFYCTKASRSEREAGLALMPLGSNMRVNAPRQSEAEKYAPARNTHPTVKPVALMRWLVRLVCPVGGTVLDPFAGSGTTGVACVQEGRAFIGCEREAEYATIARARIAHAAKLSDIASQQTDIFDLLTDK